MAPKTSLPLPSWSDSDILSTRDSSAVISEVLVSALDLMILGHMESANGLVTALHENNALLMNQFFNKQLKPGLYHAWLASDALPPFIQNPDPDIVFDGFEEDIRKELSELDQRLREDWPESLREKWPAFEKADLDLALERLENAPQRPGVRDDEPRLSIAVEIAMRLGEKEKAESLIKEHVVKGFRHLALWPTSTPLEKEQMPPSRQHVARSEKAWEILKEKAVGNELGVDDIDVQNYVNEGIKLINQRFKDGPVSKYSHMSIPDIIKAMDQHYVAARQANPICGRYMGVRGPDEVPDSFLVAGATDAEIEELEKELSTEERSVKLPEDYKTFLRTSNGFYGYNGPMDMTSIFFGIEAIERDESDEAWMSDLTLALFDFDEKLEIEDIHGFSIGAGGDEGNTWLIDPDCVKRVLAKFEEVYAKASAREKRAYERKAMDCYGGLDEMREMNWLLILFYHWEAEPHVYKGFRGYLEYAACESERQRKKDELDAERGKKRKREEAGNNKKEKQDGIVNQADEDTNGNDEEDDNETSERYNLRPTSARKIE